MRNWIDLIFGSIESQDEPNWDSKRSIEFLKLAREEAHRTIDNQARTLGEIDQKAARLLRINLILLGIILTGLSIAVNGGRASPEAGTQNSAVVNASDLLNLYTTAGLVLLFGSTIVAGLTYTASHLRIGMSGPNLMDALWNDYSDKENLEGMIESYSRWIRQNYRTNALNAPLGTLTILLLIYAMGGLGLGVVEAINGRTPLWLLIAVLLVLAVVTYLAGIIGQFKRYFRLRCKSP